VVATGEAYAVDGDEVHVDRLQQQQQTDMADAATPSDALGAAAGTITGCSGRRDRGGVG
jgi:hypothetical protein